MFEISILRLIKERILLTLCSILLVFVSNGQSYFANGNARSIGGTCYQLTSAANWQLGSVWYADKLDLAKDFDLEFELNFGNNNDNGADGIVFVMQTVGTKAIGASGAGIGFEGFSPSFGIEFDTWQNTNFDDMASDHIAMFKNGSVDHKSSNSLVAATTAIPGGANIEDGKNHLVRITWDFSDKRIQVYFDCVLRQTAVIDIQNRIFSGNNLVYWGFTSATGGSNNAHLACLSDDIIVQDTFALCKGETVLLNARESKNNSYVWTPNLYLDDGTIKNPVCSSVVPITYFVQYTDRCGNQLRDTVDVVIDQPFVMDEGKDSLLCDGAKYLFNLTNAYDSVLWQNGNRSSYKFWDRSGYYTLRAWKGVCYDDDSFNITTNESPTIAISGKNIFCEGDSVELSVTATPIDAVFTWMNGSKASTYFYDKSEIVSAKATNECGSVEDFYGIREVILPDINLGKDTLNCKGDSLLLDPKIAGPYTYRWNTSANSSTLKVGAGGTYWLEVSELDLCYASDTINVIEINKPQLGSLSDIILCKNELIEIAIDNKYGMVLWNNNVEGERYSLLNYQGKLSVKSSNECGTDSNEIEVSLIDCYCNLLFPNAITPNADQLNDQFRPTVDCPKLRDFTMSVYNRWGELLFTSTDVNKTWDGSYQDIMVMNGVYYWIAVWSGIENGQIERKADKGILHVIR